MTQIKTTASAVSDLIQRGIDRAHTAGDPRFIVPPGNHVSGTITLPSHIDLHIPGGAALLGSEQLDDYPCDFDQMVDRQHHSPALICAEHQENITISGTGCVNGRGTHETFPAIKPGDEMERPMLLRFYKCRDIYLKDVKFLNSASWGLHFIDCENIHINGITIDSRVNRNNDGIDLDGCRHVFISNCNLNTGDDAICPKSTVNITENVVISNCTIRSNTAGFKLGTSSAGGFRNISMNNCIFYRCRMGTIKLLCVDGGVLENVNISDIIMDDVEGPLFIRLGNRGINYEDNEQADSLIYSFSTQTDGPTGSSAPGVLRNVTIRNVTARVRTHNPARSGIMITGLPGHYVENVVLRDTRISFPGGGTAEDAAREVLEDATRYPEQFFFGILPSYGAFVRHARDIRFENVILEAREEDQRQKIVLDDVEGFLATPAPD